jgi:hypothetical protein
MARRVQATGGRSPGRPGTDQRGLRGRWARCDPCAAPAPRPGPRKYRRARYSKPNRTFVRSDARRETSGTGRCVHTGLTCPASSMPWPPGARVPAGLARSSSRAASRTSPRFILTATLRSAPRGPAPPSQAPHRSHLPRTWLSKTSSRRVQAAPRHRQANPAWPSAPSGVGQMAGVTGVLAGTRQKSVRCANCCWGATVCARGCGVARVPGPRTVGCAPAGVTLATSHPPGGHPPGHTSRQPRPGRLRYELITISGNLFS